MTWELIIPGIAAGLFMLALGIELLMHDREKAKKVELSIRKKQREVKEFQKKKDTKAMMEANKELMGLMSQNFRLRMKTMMISMPMFLIVLWLLNGMLNIAPLTPGHTTQIGVDVKNLQSSQLELRLDISTPVEIIGIANRTVSLDDSGDQGDRQQIWWNVTPVKGAGNFALQMHSGNKTDRKSFSFTVVEPGTLHASFTPEGPSTALDGAVSIAPLYKGVEVNIFGMTIGWFWYYFFMYMAISLLLLPVKNRILWGHHKGIKHIEKMEREKEGKLN